MANFETGPELPSITIDMGDDERIVLNYFTARVRMFKDPQYNNVEYRKDPQAPLCGLRVTEELINMMLEHSYPQQFDPIVDPLTQEWYIKAVTAHLDDELEGLE